MDEFIGFMRINGVGDCPMFERSYMVKGVITHSMTIIDDLIIEVMVSQHILSNHEKGSFDIIFPKRFKDERCDLENGP